MKETMDNLSPELRELVEWAHKWAYNWGHKLVGVSDLPTLDDVEEFATWYSCRVADFGEIEDESFPVLLEMWLASR